MNYLIMFVNIFVFVVQVNLPEYQEVIKAHGFVPQEFSLGDAFTSMWMHGGFLHILSNMWFLKIFGDNVEDSLGHVSYVLIYMTGGFVSVFAQYIINPQSALPLIGASGAISAVIGMYIVLFSHATIKALVPSIMGFWHIVELPSWVFLGYWFVIQVLSGVSSLATGQSDLGGVAFFAHLGGFVYGFIVAKVWYTKGNVESS